MANASISSAFERMWQHTVAALGNKADTAYVDDLKTKVGDTSVSEQIESAIANIQTVNIDSIYPVGSIYMSTVNTSPASFLGGTWEQIQDRFLLGAGSSYSAGSTGGEATHKLTINEIPSHNHGTWLEITTVASSLYLQRGTTHGDVAQNTTYTGGGGAHNNMPPYLAVYMWKRIA